MNHQPHIPSFLEGKTVVLASRSPRRQELLRLITEDFTVRVSHFDEGPLMAKAGSLSPEELVKALSAGKAQAVLGEAAGPDVLVIGGDTVVVSPSAEIFGIPRDREDAARMLRALSGQIHRVVTGMTICGDGSAFSFAVSTDVEFYPLSETEIAAYLDTGEPFDKAGGYGIQGYGGLLVRGIRGSYDNVVGLPAAELSRNLRKFCQK